MPRMKVAQVTRPELLEIVERDVPEPRVRQVRIRWKLAGFATATCSR